MELFDGKLVDGIHGSLVEGFDVSGENTATVVRGQTHRVSTTYSREGSKTL